MVLLILWSIFLHQKATLDDSTLGIIRSFYGEAKRFGETMCAAYHAEHGIPVKSVRPFHIHGPGLRPDDGRIIAALTSCAGL